MHPFIEKYHQTKGTHCWFCEREYQKDIHVYKKKGLPLERSREHIIPKHRMIYSYSRNYIASCKDCNSLKGRRDAKEFAEKIKQLMSTLKKGEHNMYNLFPTMLNRAWKLYNKTSNLHKNYKVLRTEN